MNPQLKDEIIRMLDNLNADFFLKAVIASCNDTHTEEETIQELKNWNDANSEK